MTNFQPELPLYFENGKDLVWFTDEQDLLKKCEYYLLHEDERKAIAARGYEKVKEHHNLTGRVEQLLSICSR